MTTSKLTWLFKKSPPISRLGRKQPNRSRFALALETLGDRVLPAVTATFTAAGETLKIVGDDQANSIVVSRTAAGTILVNNGAIPILGGPATIANTLSIMMNGVGGNDNLSLNEANGTMPAASIFGGDGNDTLIGGSGIDFIDGGTGSDTAFLGAADDTFQWNPGDGSDIVDGQGGFDNIVFNGSDLAEKFEISDSGSGSPFHRVRLTRDVGNIAMDLSGIEDVDLNANGGADTIAVNDQTATDIVDVNLDLGGIGFGDGQTDAVIINGTAGDDFGQIASFGTFIGANVSFFPFVNITGSEGTKDTLSVNTLGGNDGVDAFSLAPDLIGLTVNGGAGNDTFVGSQGDDTFVWNPGDGSDSIDGQAGFDKLVFNGSDNSEKVDISANGSRVKFTRDVGGITMDLVGIEATDVNALGGADSITVNDLSVTDLFAVQLSLKSSVGGGDGQADAVIVNGTDLAEIVDIAAFDNGTIIGVGGLVPKFSIIGAEPSNDRLTVNTLGGNDVLDASTLPANLIGLTLNGGTGSNVIKTPLFGDANGDGRVDSADFAAFRLVFGTSFAIFDFDGNGIVDAADFAQFRLSFGTSV